MTDTPQSSDDRLKHIAEMYRLSAVAERESRLEDIRQFVTAEIGAAKNEIHKHIFKDCEGCDKLQAELRNHFGIGEIE